jgi:hypothetical protein
MSRDGTKHETNNETMKTMRANAPWKTQAASPPQRALLQHAAPV